ncbi:hypothetical protein [Azospirillum picis]|uniref:Nutrient deprivation-induced protein n=1 Tax=Azospirillum picis TaxID=488438 RepID=A0ABU0MT22_9PROT|nr:hypothetical protein [Azospirillum picis]MBP2302898.1 hypothetical protein [Azospirillum picis]MDQ0536597.1 hypothetical protein [Azospirillum picis]
MPNRDMTGTGGPNPTGTNTDRMVGGESSGGRSGAEDMKKTVNRAADEALQAGRDTLGNAQGRIRSLLEQQTGRAADQLGGVANALHKAAEQLTEENNGMVAGYAEQAADRVERVADMLRDADFDDIVGEVEGFARRQPEVFIGAAFAVGFLAARFIKSSGERRMHRASTSLRSGSRQSRELYRDHSGRADTHRTPDRAMAGGIGESAAHGTAHSPSHSPVRTGDLSTGGVTGRTGEPAPARIGMPLAAAPASVSGRAAAPSAETAVGTVGTTGSAASAVNSGTTGVGATPAGTATSATTKPQGQRP